MEALRIAKGKPDATILLLMDGFGGHEDADLGDELRNKHIMLYRFIAHSSHISQPLDNGFYRSFKARLGKVCWIFGFFG